MSEEAAIGSQQGDIRVQLDHQQLSQIVGDAVDAKLQPLLLQSPKVGRKRKSESDFKYRGNHVQFEFNEGIAALVQMANKKLRNESTGSVGDALVILDKVEKQLHKNNELVRIADRSKHGWATVDEYVSDDLASDSEDEKRIKKAEDRASKRIRPGSYRQPFRGQAPFRGRNWFKSNGPYGGSWPLYYQGVPGSVEGPATAGPSMFNSQPFFQTRGMLIRGYQGAARTRGSCYTCGKFDHYASACPLKDTKQSL